MAWSPASTPSDVGRAFRFAQRIEAGSVWINGWYPRRRLQAPTGGIKDSGIGRERGLAGIRNYLQIKNVAIRLGGGLPDDAGPKARRPRAFGPSIGVSGR